MRGLCLLLSIVLLGAHSADAANWPQFRGAASDGHIEGSLPTEWDANKNVKWKMPVEGEGWSCPVIWGDKLFITTAVLKKEAAKPEPPKKSNPNRKRRNRYGRVDMTTAVYSWEVHCINAKTGKPIWKKVVHEGNPKTGRHKTNTYATETPVTDGEFIYAYFGMGWLFCYDLDGNFQWKRDLGSYQQRANWGTASSPVLHDGKIFVQNDNNEKSFLVAINCKDGKDAWRIPREETATQYSSPVIWKNSKRTELVTGGVFARSYDPQTGKELWKLDMKVGRSSATALPHGDRLYIGNELRSKAGNDQGGGIFFSVKAGASGDISPKDGETTSDGVAWSLEKSGIQMASPVIAKGYIYLFQRRSGILTCVNAETGESAYMARIPGGTPFWASPWTVGDKVFCLDDSGTTHVIEAGPKLKIINKNSIDEQFWSTPSFANGALYMRGAKYLYCIEKS